ncbi:ATP-grasp domain-containing protein [Natrinema halophilum]|uniref:ATP-grasp domain-containing protein n=1 Tax=Natrinema halophilum TaxID=1699371 RepID=A0A7D5GHU7_9EURY|nr:ATP-grasp domain-containing protein [Natrinema halophilum]QLG49247.1 ATP-grasp domain-containing protein [Natrinema halophilum]
MGVLLIGPEADLQVKAVTRELEKRGVETALWDASSWPGDVPATVRHVGDQTSVSVADTEEIPAEYHTIYLRQLGFDARYPEFESELDERPLSVINQIREYRGLLLSAVKRLQDEGVRVINPPEAMSIHDLKPWQLSTLSAAGVPVPETCSTNDPDEVRTFANRVEDVIYKPVTGGGHAHRLEKDDLEDERLTRLANSPVQFQERIDGDDVRVFVVDGEAVAAARIVSDALDYRSVEHDVERIPLDSLDPEIERAACRAATQLELPFTGVDVIDGSDRFVVLEANPSPMFATFDELAGTRVADELAAFLADP